MSTPRRRHRTSPSAVPSTALGARVFAFAVVALLVWGTTPNAHAFPGGSRQQVLDYLRSLTGSGIVSGQHNKEPAASPGQYTQQVKGVTGQYPGLWGGDLMFRAEDVANRQRVVDQAKTEWANGSLVTLTWHVCPPTTGSSCEFDGGVKSRITDAQFAQVVTDGTALNTAWKRRLDEAVPYLQQLKAAGVPVLFRPLHEMNETWNWWGHRPGPDGGARLYRITRDHLAAKGLDNLVWVWNVQDNPEGRWADYYPGDAYVDVVSLDVWYKNHPSASDYRQMQDIARGKPIALAEMGKVPDSALLDSQTRWAYFMIWSEQLRGNNTNAEIQAAYFHPRVLNQGEVRLPAAGGTSPAPRTGPITGPAGKCADTAGVRTPVRLWNCDGSGAQQWRYDTSTRSLRNPQSGRCPDVTGHDPADRTRSQIRDRTGDADRQGTPPTT
ncbi:glycosyl hydrolase [Streptomyces roseolilacinus]|uniref:glycosyl hydrolase n=1 Tax=Streptomyces roseolilacinus TaxID=66904 RepID=UPI003823A6D5